MRSVVGGTEERDAFETTVKVQEPWLFVGGFIISHGSCFILFCLIACLLDLYCLTLDLLLDTVAADISKENDGLFFACLPDIA